MCTALRAGENNSADASTEAAGAVTAVTAETPTIPARKGAYKDDFAALNAQREGVIVLPSTVQYEVLKEGSGRQPAEGDTVVINYVASLTNGNVFDTTYGGEPLTIPLNKIVIPGLKEALLLMNEGDQWRVVIPPRMGFGQAGNNRVRRRDLIYEVELISTSSHNPSIDANI